MPLSFIAAGLLTVHNLDTLIITEVVDGPLPGGQPKWIELANISEGPLELSEASGALGGGASGGGGGGGPGPRRMLSREAPPLSPGPGHLEPGAARAPGRGLGASGEPQFFL